MKRIAVLLLLLGLYAPPGDATTPADTREYRQWIAAMKEQPRGPFKELRWYCNDGTSWPPIEYACVEHGGGYQHGALSGTTQILRANGYWIANLLAGYAADNEIHQPGFLDFYHQLLIERYLIRVDNGWILERALFYRGAIQEEDEREGARKLLLALTAEREWTGTRYPALRTGVALLPHGKNTVTVMKIRQVSASLSDLDPGFKTLRGKIHGTPETGDAQRVREYALQTRDPDLRIKYESLANDIDSVYQAVPLAEQLTTAARAFSAGPWLQKILYTAAQALRQDATASHHYRITSRLLLDLRNALPRIRQPTAKLRVLDLSLAVEADNFSASTRLRERLPQATRQQRFALLRAAVSAAYGTGAIDDRSRRELERSLARVNGNTVTLESYMQALGYLARVPGWGTQSLRFHFYESMQKLAEIEPMALLFIQDQLRGSPLLFYSQLLDGLLQDANRLAGIRHSVFGKEIGAGFRALNPGLARGILHANPDPADHAAFDPDGIYLLPDTIAELPPVAGIMTAGEGNPLSHIQLLARNLGIPNAGINEDLMSVIRQHDGERVVLAISPAGQVELVADNNDWGIVFGDEDQNTDVIIRPDLEKLDLTVRSFLTLESLRASDSGRTVGPKAAKLGELQHAYPEAVAPGLAIPFGVFKQTVLDQPYGDTGQSVFEWMVWQYRIIDSLQEDSLIRRDYTEQFRADIYDRIVSTRLDSRFQQRLRQAMLSAFGPGEDYGVFIRSDTNVEDLAGFTGAGLNLTLPNVTRFENIVAGIPRVWASPFTARAFAWRQSRMETPEHVYPAVLLMQSVSNDKSGVMVTRDIDSGNPDILSVAVNEGVGGAVDGQSAESLRIDTRDGSVQLLAKATARWRRVPLATGGVARVPTSGSETVLQPDEIRQLIHLALELPQQFPALMDEQGNTVAADIEFGFLDGKLYLFQIRPFLESRQARSSNYLHQKDQSLVVDRQVAVNMQEVPR